MDLEYLIQGKFSILDEIGTIVTNVLEFTIYSH